MLVGVIYGCPLNWIFDWSAILSVVRSGRGDKKDDDVVSLKSNGTDNGTGKRAVPTLCVPLRVQRLAVTVTPMGNGKSVNKTKSNKLQ